MRFLQKPESLTKEEHDSRSNKKSQKKKNKKSRHSSEKEISRYFDAGGTRPGDNDTVQRRHTPPPNTSAVVRNVQSASPVVSNLLEKPFLGFGSRGTHRPTTSYYSWSESGRASSARVTQLAPVLEPLAAGQLQSSRAREQIKGALPEQETIQNRSADQATTKIHSKSQNPISEPAQEISQAAHLPLEPQVAQEIASEALPVHISDKNSIPIPTSTSLAPQNEARLSCTNRTSSTDRAPYPLDSNQCGDIDKLIQQTLSSNPVVEQYSMPWEELLQSCEQAARPSIPTYYDEVPLQYNLPGIQDHYPLDPRDQYTPAAYGHADLRLWGLNVGDYAEHDYPDNTAFVGEHVHWAQPEAIEYQDDSRPCSEETLEEDSEPLDSHDGYDLPAEDGVQWDEGVAEQHDGTQDFRFRDDEAMDEFAMFWQPNRLY
ncbi:unnamed protein product [Aureobasidium uvarum]|uniref:Uncharacterized protein n=1 Tax=Aureobasidium uvarum TaxID=2773716 RepID=A0A9N8PVY3_9PEZI|nr:unnamed protein product [Aureobasidium uvarum]